MKPGLALAALLALPATAGAAPPAAGADDGFAAGRRIHDPIAGFTFSAGTPSLHAPGQPLRIRTGDTVVWTNLDPVPHDVSFEALPFAVYLRVGETAELTFAQPGRYLFHCAQHHELPSMHGLVYVE